MFQRDMKAILAQTGRLWVAALVLFGAVALPKAAIANDQRYSQNEIIDVGHNFFGTISTSFAKVIERTFSTNGKPNGYILGEEAAGAYIGGLRYGEGTLFTRNAGDHRVFWQGPSVGFDWGGDGARTMILVYNLDSIDSVYRRFAGVAGQAYAVGGVGVTYLRNGNVALVPVKTGVGARVGVNVGYLKLTRTPTWNPF